MGILELVKEHLLEEAHQKGIEQGIEKGREEGIEKGREEGIEKGREEGIEKGREEGIEKGREEGMTKGELLKAKRVTVRIMEKYPKWTDQDLAEIVEMPLKFVQQVRAEMLKKKSKRK